MEKDNLFKVSFLMSILGLLAFNFLDFAVYTHYQSSGIVKRRIFQSLDSNLALIGTVLILIGYLFAIIISYLGMTENNLLNEGLIGKTTFGLWCIIFLLFLGGLIFYNYAVLIRNSLDMTTYSWSMGWGFYFMLISCIISIIALNKSTVYFY